MRTIAERTADARTALADPALWRWEAVAGWIACCVLVGCQQPDYQAQSIPPFLAAAPVIDMNGVDLSSLAYNAIPSDSIQQGDTLSLTMVTGAEERPPQAWPLLVSDDGTVNVPLVGSVSVANLDLQTAQDTIRQASIQRGVYRSPSVNVGLTERRTHRVTVVGAVNEPGTYEIAAGEANVLAALVAAGGLTEAADRIVEVRPPPPPPRPPSSPASSATGPTFARPPQAPPQNEPRMANSNIVPVSYLEPAADSVSRGGFEGDLLATQPADQPFFVDLVSETVQRSGRDLTLRDGAVINVRKRPERSVHVMGLVRKPDQFQLPPNKNIHLLDALAMAGGTPSGAADKVYIIRRTNNPQEPVLIKASIREAKGDGNANLLLADGDVISVEETPLTMLTGFMQNFMRVTGTVPFP